MSHYELYPMSPEQEQIVECIVTNNNVIVDSVAGSGKTTTCLHICKHLPDKNILILTYNSRLKIESREKVKLLNLKNVEVHSYHAFCVKYYDEKGYRDDGIQYAIINNVQSKKKFAFDIIILDEQQDMTKLFYNLARKIINNNITKDIQICSFGDIYQNIYAYAGSDERYLIYANKIFADVTHGKEWKLLKLSTSYRITIQIANFINIIMLKTDRLKAIKNGPNVKYVITDSFKDTYIYNEIIKYLSIGYLPEDIFILGASLKKGKKMSPICKLENKLVSTGIPCHASLSDDTKVDEDIIKGKVCFASFHQVKGMERKICIVYGFDESYFNYYAKNLDPGVCPNVLYVALTRASDRLILIHDCHNNYLPFLSKQLLNMTCDVIINKKYIGGAKPPSTPITVNVRDLIRNISNDSMNYIFSFINYKTMRPANKHPISLQSKILTKKDLHEDVSDINGLAIPALYEYANTHQISMLEQIMGHISSKKAIGITCSNLPEMHKIMIYNIYQKYLNRQMTTEDILYVSTVYNSLLTGFIGKREQIVHYNWCEQKETESALQVMERYVSNSAQYEQQIMHCVHNKIIVGIIDAIDYVNNTMFEFKCTSEISKEHILQLVIYSHMYEKTINNINESKAIKIMSEYTAIIEGKKIPELIQLCKEEGVDLYRKIDDVNTKKVKKGKNELIMSLIDHKKKNVDNHFGKRGKMMYKLLNILTEEIIEIQYDDAYGNIIEYLLSIGNTHKANDDDFISGCENASLDNIAGHSERENNDYDEDYENNFGNNEIVHADFDDFMFG